MSNLRQDRRPSSRSLGVEEREAIIIFSDADQTWFVYSDSRSQGGALRRVAQRIGVEVRPVGNHGFEFEAPRKALRLAARRRGGGRPGGRRPPPVRTRRKSGQYAAAEAKVALLAGV